MTNNAEYVGRREPVGDVVYTPGWVVDDMLAHFTPTGVVLDPCRGRGAFHDRLPEGSPWCEITDGRDFFDWTDPVDWIVGNPPFSKSNAWFRHSFDLAENVLYLLPLRHMFSAYGRLTDVLAWGGVKEIRLYGGGARVGFPMGNAVGAVHMVRGYTAGTRWSDQKKETAMELTMHTEGEDLVITGLPPIPIPQYTGDDHTDFHQRSLLDALAVIEQLCRDEQRHAEAFNAVYKSVEACAGGRCDHEYDYECGSDAVLAFTATIRAERHISPGQPGGES